MGEATTFGGGDARAGVVPILATAAPPPPARVAVTGFEAETVALLRRRLTAVCLVTSVLMALALLPTLGLPLLGPRLLLLALMAALWLRLRRPDALPMPALRRYELIIFGAIAAQLVAMPAALMVQSARAGHDSTVVMDGYFVQSFWVLNIITYGLLIPNRWPRALAVLTPAAVAPYATCYLAGVYEPRVRAAFDGLAHGPPLPVVPVAVGVAIAYAHVLDRVRREVHRARRFGQYRLGARVGSGTMGVVHRAEHELLKRDCAVKLIRPGVDADPAAVALFEAEVRATARLSHWNSVGVYDYGRTDDGTFYYVMELLSGMSLADLARRAGPLPPGRAVFLLAQVCEALREAHSLGLVHRDVKPANVFAARVGGVADVAKLLDFGLVHPADVAAGVAAGTPAFMAPEQALGVAIDGRADLYALGAVGYFLLTGRPPFDAATPQGQMAAHVSEAVIPPSARGAAVPADLEAVILRCLRKRPDERYPDAAALRDALLACACAADWDAARAAAWWAARPEPPGPAESGSALTIAPR